VFAFGLICWFAMKFTIGISTSDDDVRLGLDKVERGLEAHPEFSKG
jgi:hypothetical protein